MNHKKELLRSLWVERLDHPRVFDQSFGHWHGSVSTWSYQDAGAK